MVVAAGYVGSRSLNQHRVSNPQMPIPVRNAEGRLVVPTQVARNPNLSEAGTFVVWDAHSTYDALQLEAEKRLGHGLRFKAAFTWSKAIDDSLENQSSPQGSAEAATLMTDPTFDRGLAAFHVGRRLAVNYSYQFPYANQPGVLGAVFGDWQLSGITQVQDGVPFTAWTGFRRSFGPGAQVDRPDLAPGASTNPILGGPDRYFDPMAFVLPAPGVLGNVGNNTLIGPGLALTDVSLLKSVSVGGSRRIQFRLEVFNLFNRANFGLPANNLFSADGTRLGSAGRIATTVTTAREFQFSVKFAF